MWLPPSPLTTYTQWERKRSSIGLFEWKVDQFVMLPKSTSAFSLESQLASTLMDTSPCLNGTLDNNNDAALVQQAKDLIMAASVLLNENMIHSVSGPKTSGAATVLFPQTNAMINHQHCICPVVDTLTRTLPTSNLVSVGRRLNLISIYIIFIWRKAISL